jgi:hypothetical protein
VEVTIDEATAFTLFGTVVTGEQVGVSSGLCKAVVVTEPPVVVEPGEVSRRIGLPLI